MELEPIIGLEIHVQLKTKSKMFCACDNAGDQRPPNTTICPICTGQPGTLPMLNTQAVQWGIQVALALNCQIGHATKFDRKNYFYPDLPKGYQISQYDLPIAREGQLSILFDGERRTFGIERAHLEEDAAKLLHTNDNVSLVDFNRAGTPLIEIVTRPDFHSPVEAKAFLQELRLVLRLLGVSDADMEKGHLRCDANVSLRPVGEVELYPKTEIKNLNSFRSVERALHYEIDQQTILWNEGRQPKKQQTKGWDEKKQQTVAQRVKEELSDYRYFPEPDIPPLEITEEEIKLAGRLMPELPMQLRVRLQTMYGLDHRLAKPLLQDKDLIQYFEQVMSELQAWDIAEHPNAQANETEQRTQTMSKLAYNWLTNTLAGLLLSSNQAWSMLKITAEDFAEFIKLVFTERITSKAARNVLQHMFDTGQDPSSYVEEHDLAQLGTTEDLELTVDKVIRENPDQVGQYRAGKIVVLQYLLGQIMKESRGRANPDLAKEMLISKLQ